MNFYNIFANGPQEVSNETLSRRGVFSVEYFFSPQGHVVEALYAGDDDILVVFRPLSFDPQQGGRFMLSYSYHHFFGLFQRKRHLILTLSQNEKGKWVLSDDKGGTASQNKD